MYKQPCTNNYLIYDIYYTPDRLMGGITVVESAVLGYIYAPIGENCKNFVGRYSWSKVSVQYKAGIFTDIFLSDPIESEIVRPGESYGPIWGTLCNNFRGVLPYWHPLERLNFLL